MGTGIYVFGRKATLFLCCGSPKIALTGSRSHPVQPFASVAWLGFPLRVCRGDVSGDSKICCCFVASVDPLHVVVCRHVPTVAGSVLETQSVHTRVGIRSGNAGSSASAVAL